jgi:hypothetical protein
MLFHGISHDELSAELSKTATKQEQTEEQAETTNGPPPMTTPRDAHGAPHERPREETTAWTHPLPFHLTPAELSEIADITQDVTLDGGLAEVADALKQDLPSTAPAAVALPTTHATRGVFKFNLSPTTTLGRTILTVALDKLDQIFFCFRTDNYICEAASTVDSSRISSTSFPSSIHSSSLSFSLNTEENEENPTTNYGL